MDCQNIEFSPEKSRERVAKAVKVLGRKLLDRIIGFVLYLLGAKRKVAAEAVGMPEESLKTAIGLIMRDGFSAFRDRRQSEASRPSANASVEKSSIAVRREGEWCVVELAASREPLMLPLARSDSVQARTVLLSMASAGWLSMQEAASILDLSYAHCRELADRLHRDGVVATLVDKRQGQLQDYRVTPPVKAEIIQQFSARCVAGYPTSSDALANAVHEHAKIKLSARTLRWHVAKLGLAGIRETLPKLLQSLKKKP